ncbi:V-type ATP synthase subunit B [Thermaurantiacus sp.]
MPRGSAMGLVRYRRVLSIVGDTLVVEGPEATAALQAPRLADLALVREEGAGSPLQAAVPSPARSALAEIIRLDGRRVHLQLFGSSAGFSTAATVSFLLSPPEVVYTPHALGRVFNGIGRLIDGGPPLDLEPVIAVRGAPANPVRRELAQRMLATNIPMIDVFNSLVESQKIPIFSVPGEPHDQLLLRIGAQADADIVIFAGIALMHDDYLAARDALFGGGRGSRTIMFVNLASDPVVERLLVPDLALALAERFAVEQKKRVLVLMTDMTAFADALTEVGLAQDRVPANRGYLGDLYSELARRYERACLFRDGGSVTIVSVCTMPGNDVTHPSPDNTGYITEGQIYLNGGEIDPFGSLSRLKQHVVGKQTRGDHGQVMNAMIGLYAAARDARQKEAMAFELSDHDRRLLRFEALFRKRFMDIAVDLPLEPALDLCWQTMAECFAPEELAIRRSLIDSYWPRPPAGAGNPGTVPG